jgi:hypothetical protein
VVALRRVVATGLEWMSAVLAFAAATLIGVGVVRLRRGGLGRTSRRVLAIPVAVAVLSLLIGLEEVSWFQRVLQIEVPEGLRERNQPELNFHNSATGLSENAYYVGAFLFTVALPALVADRAMPGSLPALDLVLPGRVVLYGSVTAGALVYEMWEIVPIQIVFFISLALIATDRARLGSLPLGPVLAVVTAALHLFGDRMTRSWDNTEVRELLLTFGLLLYAVGLSRRPLTPTPDANVAAPTPAPR